MTDEAQRNSPPAWTLEKIGWPIVGMAVLGIGLAVFFLQGIVWLCGCWWSGSPICEAIASNPPWLLCSGIAAGPSVLLTWYWRTRQKNRDQIQRQEELEAEAMKARRAVQGDFVQWCGRALIGVADWGGLDLEPFGELPEQAARLIGHPGIEAKLLRELEELQVAADSLRNLAYDFEGEEPPGSTPPETIQTPRAELTVRLKRILYMARLSLEGVHPGWWRSHLRQAGLEEANPNSEAKPVTPESLERDAGA